MYHTMEGSTILESAYRDLAGAAEATLGRLGGEVKAFAAEYIKRHLEANPPEKKPKDHSSMIRANMMASAMMMVPNIFDDSKGIGRFNPKQATESAFDAIANMARSKSINGEIGSAYSIPVPLSNVTESFSLSLSAPKLAMLAPKFSSVP